MIKDGKLFGKINLLDFVIVLVILLGGLGIFLIKTHKLATSAKQIKGESNIEFDVAIRGLKLSKVDDLFKKGDKSFITIRNVPYTSLEIIKSQMTPWQTVIPDPKNPSKAISVTDPSEPYTYNFLITLEDKATITDDGPVIGGNKIKIGLPVTLEGFDYKLNGSVSDVRVEK